MLHSSADPASPLLLFMPAMGTRARYYSRIGEAMAAAGVSFASCDWRGIETSSLRASRTCDFGYRHLVELDIPAAAAALSERLPLAPLWMGGHSLGGQLSALYASRHATTVRGLVIVAAGTVHFNAWDGSGALRILALTQSAMLISRVVGHYPGARIGFAGREARGVIGDWASVARHGRYLLAGSKHDYETSMAQLQKPVLALGFEADHLAPAKATEALLAKLPKCHRTHLRWSAAETAGLALDHFSWAKRPELVVPTISSWVRERGREFDPSRSST
ncbi:MAG: alpha/beta hydrolase family protein [Panacagrimonas sp.]